MTRTNRDSEVQKSDYIKGSIKGIPQRIFMHSLVEIDKVHCLVQMNAKNLIIF